MALAIRRLLTDFPFNAKGTFHLDITRRIVRKMRSRLGQNLRYISIIALAVFLDSEVYILPNGQFRTADQHEEAT